MATSALLYSDFEGTKKNINETKVCEKNAEFETRNLIFRL